MGLMVIMQITIMLKKNLGYFHYVSEIPLLKLLNKLVATQCNNKS